MLMRKINLILFILANIVLITFSSCKKNLCNTCTFYPYVWHQPTSIDTIQPPPQNYCGSDWRTHNFQDNFGNSLMVISCQ